MKNKVLLTLFASALLLASGGAVARSFIHSTKVEVTPVLAGEGSYYSDISDSLTGTALLNALHTLNNKKRTKTVGYAGMRTFAAKSDIDPDGSGKIIGFYDNKKIGPSWDGGDTWNREHVWPDIRGGNLVEADAHMVRPAATSTNGDRGSKGYGEESYDPGQFVPYYRGAAARIIFYAAIADTDLQIVDYPFNYDGVGGGNNGYPANSMGALSDMLKWNLQYLPSDTSFTGNNDIARRTELNRNEVIQTNSSGQGNRNPFIDHPEYACKIWGNTNDATKAICNGSSGGEEGGETIPEYTEATITVNKSKVSLGKDKTFTLVTTTLDGSKVTYSFSENASKYISYNAGKTTYNSGEPMEIVGKKKGKVLIYATNVTTKEQGLCAITVTEVNLPLVIGLGVGGGAAVFIVAPLVVILIAIKRRPI